MTDVIQLLPDSVANQIAAGEVIQRPASVIKELVENAVDAGATTINVLVVDAGRTSIQVIDNGCGMSETDARLAFERHATSKIRKADDLFSLHTMGFRGEALPSIAAVAQVELRTRRAEDEVGTCLRLSGSHVESQEPCSCAVGSSFTVSNIFFNVPARRKFLKTNATELNNILTAFERIVLVYPDISFTLHSNGQELMNLHSGSLRQRITDVYGRRYGQDLLPVSVDTEMCKITGFTGKPEAARKKGAHEYFFVNGRFMKHAYFHKAVQQAYDRLVQLGTHVPYFIYFDVAPADIDVNIHPTKTEIKFENEQAIWQILAAAVKDAIGQFCEIPQIDFDTEGRPDIPAYSPVGSDAIAAPKVSTSPQYNPFRQKPSQDWQRLYEGLPKETPSEEPPLFPEAKEIPEQSPVTDIAPTHYQYKGRYVMTAVKSGLMIIDQHRADVRIRYERYQHQLTEAPAQSQRLLFPEMVELSSAEAVLMADLLPSLTALGFELTPIGPTAYAVNGVPAGLEGLQPDSLLRDILTDAAEHSGHTSNLLPLTSNLSLSLARHAAIPYGQLLSNEEMDILVNDLFACENVNYTPDGRAILCILPQHDIDHLLGASSGT
ncbi:MAG: DNA mismatch repair endonuclease MutL [Prevotella sp.]|nr:DNA mismatch repair endonuclease MutL [Prevotella sp.]